MASERAPAPFRFLIYLHSQPVLANRFHETPFFLLALILLIVVLAGCALPGLFIVATPTPTATPRVQTVIVVATPTPGPLPAGGLRAATMSRRDGSRSISEWRRL